MVNYVVRIAAKDEKGLDQFINFCMGRLPQGAANILGKKVIQENYEPNPARGPKTIYELTLGNIHPSVQDSVAKEFFQPGKNNKFPEFNLEVLGGQITSAPYQPAPTAAKQPRVEL